MSAIDYRPIGPGDYEAVREFLAGQGWDRRVADRERFAKMMARADRTMMALEAGRVVGWSCRSAFPHPASTSTNASSVERTDKSYPPAVGESRRAGREAVSA